MSGLVFGARLNGSLHGEYFLLAWQNGFFAICINPCSPCCFVPLPLSLVYLFLKLLDSTFVNFCPLFALLPFLPLKMFRTVEVKIAYRSVKLSMSLRTANLKLDPTTHISVQGTNEVQGNVKSVVTGDYEKRRKKWR